ncbi:hypothetical protein Nmel_017557, partial [Mimus melanotis]
MITKIREAGTLCHHHHTKIRGAGTLCHHHQNQGGSSWPHLDKPH